MAMARGRSDDGTRAVKRRKQQKRLYVLVDDWERGYSVQKLDTDAMDADDDSISNLNEIKPTRFRDPPVARMEAQHARSWSFVAHGTKIFAMQPNNSSPAIPALDVATLSTAICPWPPCRCDFGRPLFVSLAGKIFLFLSLHTYYIDISTSSSKAAAAAMPASWTTIHERLPFAVTQVSSYATHPDGRTLFVSAGARAYPDPDQRQRHGTFSFDAGILQWTHHGEWLLPFEGQAFFDRALGGGAWVGLCRIDHDNGGATAGRLCCCDVVDPNSGSTATPAPRTKLLEEKLFDKAGPGLPTLHVGATLVSMGGRGEFCLVESRMHDDVRDMLRDYYPREQLDWRALSRRVLRVTVFRLGFDEATGALRVVSRRRTRRAAKVFRQAHCWGGPSLDPIVFWI
ncbi:hypothetical protein BRADI_3g54090v3 [Brachypodium distachyon]|uniref:DUF1618 domain-containing protein n=1 Tax=Brachypodium distachyon TaxID=15368 RepID=A0A0Q3ILD3_BRADI|nr:hypothetical protein BRADI_3g54090v3 [Brachypodium distachyon]